MHIDETKKFDKRNIEKNIKNGIFTHHDYETYLSGLPDISGKIYISEENTSETGEMEATEKEEAPFRKKGLKKKTNKPG
jgi:hypothetical protein